MPGEDKIGCLRRGSCAFKRGWEWGLWETRARGGFGKDGKRCGGGGRRVCVKGGVSSKEGVIGPSTEL